jgi:hypothetical protein
MDAIQTSLHTSQSSTTMLSRVVSDVLEFKTAGLTNSGKKRAKKNLASNVLLCRRLLLAGAGAGADGISLEKTTLLRLTVAFKNASLEALGIPEGAEPPCPGWKGCFVDELISSLQEHGAIDSSDVELGSTSGFDSASWSSHHDVASLASSETGQVLDLPSSANDADIWFHKLRRYTHSLLYDAKPKYPGRKAVRVAIIDSGISDNRHDDKVPMARRSFSKITTGQIIYKDFTGSSPTCADNDANLHGTWCASLLMQVAPRARLYVANVVQPNTAGQKVGHVAAAIAWSIEQQVDIISMSFGWKSEQPEVDEQINLARQKGIHIFAAASNYGDFTPDHGVYPASHHEVHIIYSCRGSGMSSDFNPRFTRDGLNFTFPGEDLTILEADNTPVKGVGRQKGTSFATSIAAGTAAMVLDMVRHEFKNSEDIERRLQRYEGMSNIFRAMSGDLQDGGYYHVRPWTLLGERRPIASAHMANETHKWDTLLRAIADLRDFDSFPPLS